MPDISQLDPAVQANATDLIPATQGSTGPGTGTTRTITPAQLVNAAGLAPSPGSLFGLTLANDIITPLTVLDIAAGMCADSTNLVTIALPASMTKSVSAGWSPGSGLGGMGVGLTIAGSTWYHVFAIQTATLPDVYFDTSVIAANKPAAATAFRRIGSFKTGPAANILLFAQTGDRFDWWIALLEYNGVPGHTTADVLTLQNVPTGVSTRAIITGAVNDPTGTNSILYLSSLQQQDVLPTAIGPMTASNGQAASGYQVYYASVQTNTTAQIRRRVSATTLNCVIITNGYTDSRGRS